LPLYPPPVLEKALEYFDEFYQRNSNKLLYVFDKYGKSISHSPLLFQPEVLMVFDRIEADEFSLEELWSKHFPIKELQDLALVWGRTLTY
jgi:hypothetical protein